RPRGRQHRPRPLGRRRRRAQDRRPGAVPRRGGGVLRLVPRLTSARAEALQARAGGFLLGRGLHAGDRVAYVCPNSTELLCALLGTMRVGIVPVPLNPSLLDEERATILEDAQPALVVGPDDLAALGEGPTVELAPVPLVRPMH